MAQINRLDGINSVLGVYSQSSSNVQANQNHPSSAAQVNRSDGTNKEQGLNTVQTDRRHPLNDTANANATGGGGPVDQFVRSESSSEVDRLTALVEQQPEVDEQKVERLREAIENGSFEIDSQKVAEKILETGINLNPPA